MSRTSPFSLLLACVALFLPRVVQAADVAVFAPEISNLSPQDSSTVGELIAQAYAIASQQSVVSPSYAQSALAQGQTHQAAATQLAVKEYIRLSAVGAGRSIVIGASRYQADGRLLQQVKQQAESLEAMPYTADAIARALLGQPSAAPAAPIAAYAQPRPPVELPPLKPARAKKNDDMVYGIKAGVHLPVAKDASYYSAVSLQFDARLQFPRFFLEFGAGFVIPTVMEDSDDYSEPCSFDQSTGMSVCPPAPKPSKHGFIGGITTEIGASYYLTDGNIAPYIGGGLIPRVVLAGIDSSQKRDIASMSAYGQFGFTVPRNSSTRFMCDLRVAQAILPQHLKGGREVWPTEPSLHVGIGW